MTVNSGLFGRLCAFFIAFVLCVVGTGADAATYYVSTSGSDSNNGTSTSGAVEPLVTLQNVVLTSRTGEASEANAVPGSGSLHALSDGSYWVLSVEGTGSNMKISCGQKSAVMG